MSKPKVNHRKDKPWDSEDIDHWKIEKFEESHNKHGLLEESVFSTLFPQYRESYIREHWDEIKAVLEPHRIVAEVNYIEGSMSVRTMRQTFDPYIIIKARDFIKLISRSMPVHQAKRVLEDGMYCDIIKIGGLVRNKEKFVKRRERLLGANGATLKAIELLTNCTLLIQGQTVAAIGDTKGLKQVRRIVEDCFRNVHPIYRVKELLIKREIQKDPSLAKEDWSRFIPSFKSKNVKRKKPAKDDKSQKESLSGTSVSAAPKKEKSESVFPAQPLPRKEDLAIESGEYFMSKSQLKAKKHKDKLETQHAKSKAKRDAYHDSRSRPDFVGADDSGAQSAPKRTRVV